MSPVQPGKYYHVMLMSTDNILRSSCDYAKAARILCHHQNIARHWHSKLFSIPVASSISQLLWLLPRSRAEYGLQEIPWSSCSSSSTRSKPSISQSGTISNSKIGNVQS